MQRAWFDECVGGRSRRELGSVQSPDNSIRITDDLRAAIACGALRPGDHLPTLEELAERFGVATGTTHRAVAELHTLVNVVSRHGAAFNGPETAPAVVLR